jgi:hypothetical protein
MAKPDAGAEGPETVPTKFAETTPPAGTDLSMWLLNAMTRATEAIGKIEANVAALQTQMNRMEDKLDAIKTEVKGHANWMHTLKVALAGLGILLGWIVVYAVVPWVKTKVAPGP